MQKRLRPYFLILPACLFILTIVGVGLYTSLKQSLGVIPTLGLTKPTLKYYFEVLGNADIMKSMAFSLYIALVSSVIASVLGVALAYCLYKATNNKFHRILYRLPIIIPYTVMALMVFSLLSRSGMVSRVAYHLGIIKEIDQFPTLIFDTKGIGVIIGYILKQMPFVGMMAYGVLSGISDNMVQAAANLGAPRKAVFRHILLPLSLPTIMTAWFIIFAFSFGAFEMPFLLGATDPKAISVYAYVAYTSADLSQRPIAMAINSLVLTTAIILTTSYFFLIHKVSKRSPQKGAWL